MSRKLEDLFKEVQYLKGHWVTTVYGKCKVLGLTLVNGILYVEMKEEDGEDFLVKLEDWDSLGIESKIYDLIKKVEFFTGKWVSTIHGYLKVIGLRLRRSNLAWYVMFRDEDGKEFMFPLEEWDLLEVR